MFSHEATFHEEAQSALNRKQTHSSRIALSNALVRMDLKGNDRLHKAVMRKGLYWNDYRGIVSTFVTREPVVDERPRSRPLSQNSRSTA